MGEARIHPIAMRLARIVFKKRGNHSEAHIKEAELAGIIHVAIEVATTQTRAKLDRISKGVVSNEHQS